MESRAGEGGQAVAIGSGVPGIAPPAAASTLVRSLESEPRPVGGEPLGTLPMPVFGEAEQLVLSDARDRFEFEQRSAGTLHNKSALFLTLTGVFWAFLTQFVGRLLDKGGRSIPQDAALVVFGACLGMLSLAALLLGRSAVSRKYQIIASPAMWARHLTRLRQAYTGYDAPDQRVFAHLRLDLLDAWTEAAEHCGRANEAKARALERVQLLLTSAVPLSFLGFVLLLLDSLLF